MGPRCIDAVSEAASSNSHQVSVCWPSERSVYALMSDHPRSPSTVSPLNFLDEMLLPLQPLPSGARLRATIDNLNARLGG